MVNHEAAGHAGGVWSLDWAHSWKDGPCGQQSSDCREASRHFGLISSQIASCRWNPRGKVLKSLKLLEMLVVIAHSSPFLSLDPYASADRSTRYADRSRGMDVVAGAPRQRPAAVAVFKTHDD